MLEGLAEANGLGALCHPAMHWPDTHAPEPGLKIAVEPALPEITRGDFTLETWFRTTDGGRHILMGNYASGRWGALNLELHTDNRVRVYVQPIEGKTVDLNLRADSLNIDTRDGQWHHLAAVRRGNIVQLLLNGQPLGQAENTAGDYELHGESYFVGRDHRTGRTVLEGDLDHLRIWERALSDAEVKYIYRGAFPGEDDVVSAAGMVLQYTFEAGEQMVCEDTGGHPAGPFQAAAQPGAAVTYVEDVPENLRAYDRSSRSVHMEPSPRPAALPDAAVSEYARLLTRHPHLVAMEVLNGTRPDREYELDRELWDRLMTDLMPQRPVWGLATDDMHGPSQLGRNWVTFLAPQADLQHLREAMVEGRYYFSTIDLRPEEQASTEGTPRIEKIEHNRQAGRITIHATAAGEDLPDDACRWISDGEVVHTGPTLNYRQTAGIGSYVRAELEAAGGMSFTNPFGLRGE